MHIMLEDVKTVSLHYRLPNGLQRVVTLVPGVNILDDTVWKALTKANAQRFKDYYLKIMHPFKSELIGQCRDHLFEYSQDEMLEIIKNVHSVAFLDYLLQLERERKYDFAPRKTVIEALIAKLPPKQVDSGELDRLGACYSNYVVE